MLLDKNVIGEHGTNIIANRIASVSYRGDLICLWGDLGIGKTVFARAFIRALGDPDTEVPSPTFTLLQTYGPFAGIDCLLHHFDLYRIQDPTEILELGFEEAVVDGIVLVEWPDRLGALLPAPRLDIRMMPAHRPEERQITLYGEASWEMRLRSMPL
ncbi:MAG: tRNA (adenosine(37)-N6)-threonylcarbamoyltransferase complex ATPase subunit type 1 TsaE [Rhodospirillales bacterium]